VITVFTPTHDTRFLHLAYRSLFEQTFESWEWIVLYNNGARPLRFDDPRVKEFEYGEETQNIGALKAAACSKAKGDIFVELDHDDALFPTALEEVQTAFGDMEIGFAYSNTVPVLCDGSRAPRYDPAYGWRYREFKSGELLLDERIAFPPTPESISKITFAPNHLKAWRRSVYEQVGGHNAKLLVLDDADLICRTYLAAKFLHIDKPLYLARLHLDNSWLKFNDDIQRSSLEVYDHYIEDVACRFADLNGLHKIDVCVANSTARPGMEMLNAETLAGPDGSISLPFETDSVGVMRIVDAMQRIPNPVSMMCELSRVLVPGGWALIHVPSTESRGGFQDPLAKSYWNENSFLYYTNASIAKLISTPVRFQAVRLYTTKPNHAQVRWAVAHLLNLKGDYKPAGLIEI
jgi:SAM-dependent methyltransferase